MRRLFAFISLSLISLSLVAALSTLVGCGDANPAAGTAAPTELVDATPSAPDGALADAEPPRGPDRAMGDGMVGDGMVGDGMVGDGGVGGLSSAQAALIREEGQRLSDEGGAVGLVIVAVTAAGTEVMGFGERARGGPPVDAQTVFQIGSVSKPITGLLFASLLGAPGSTMRPDDPVALHARDLPIPRGEGAPISLEHLATHYSALPNMPPGLIGPPDSPGRGYTRAMLRDDLATEGLLTGPPGAQYLYSNLGYGLLGVVLADAVGLPDYEALLRARFIEPLGLTRTGLHREAYFASVGDNLAEGYRPDGRTAVGFAEMGALAGSGEILSTGEDMAKFLRVMCGLDPYPVPSAVERALESRGPGEETLDIAYGWDMSRDAEPRWTKAGLTPGFTSYAALRRAPQGAVMILSNRGRHMPIRAVVHRILEALSGE